MSVDTEEIQGLSPGLPSTFRSQRDEEGPAEEPERSSHGGAGPGEQGASAKVRSTQQHGGGRGHDGYSSCRAVEVSLLGKRGFGKE